MTAPRTPHPYHRQPGAELFHGDGIEWLAGISPSPDRTVVITDPVWPNCPPGLFGDVDPLGLFTAAAQHFPRIARRVVVILGCNSDPRFLAAVPSSLPFVRACWLRYALPSYAGTILNSGDVAYVFGSREAPPGRTLLPGEKTTTRPTRKDALAHPCPRNRDHMLWLVENFTSPGDAVLDPFCGSGTTVWAAREAGRHGMGCDVNAGYLDAAVGRLSQGVLFPAT